MAALHRPAIPAPRVLGKRPGRLLAYAAVALVVVAAVFQVNRFSQLTSRGYEINELNRQRAEQQAANHVIEAEVARLSSLARVDIEARVRLHLEPAQQKMYVSVNHDVPARQSLPTRFLPASRPVAPPADVPWWERIIGLMPGF
jgi:hypothetical protein